MKGKRPWQVYCLLVLYTIGFVIAIYAIFEQMFIKGNIILAVFPLYFVLLIALTYIKRPWSFALNIILLSPICFLAFGASRFILMMLFLFLLPVVPIAYMLFCPATLKYFGVKKDKIVNRKQEIEIEEPNELWECPNCKSSNINTKFVCEDCEYSIV